MRTVVLDGDVQEITLDGDISINHVMNGEMGVVTRVREPLPPYTGDTIVTPTDEQQTLRTENMTLLNDIVINPIPSNYGRIEWNGSTLTVS